MAVWSRQLLYLFSILITLQTLQEADLPTSHPLCLNAAPTGRFAYPPASPHLHYGYRYRNFHLLSIDYAFRPRLRSRLTLSGRAFLRKPWVFDGGDSHSPLATHASILSSVTSTMPYSFCFDDHTMLLYQSIARFHSFGIVFSPGYFRRRVT